MIDHDAAMIRGGNNDVKYDLAVGQPDVVRFSFSSFTRDMVEFSSVKDYPIYQGQPQLLELLKKIFKAKYAVVTNGCKQAIFAAVDALQREANEGRGDEKQAIYHWQPFHWPSYQTIADYMVLNFKSGNHGALRAINVVTWPNNPDGMQTAPKSNFLYDIWDAAYASPIYGFNGTRPKHKISVWSAAKLFGVPGLRIGWALTDDERFANKMAQYIEKTTSGVSTVSQNFLTKLLTELEATDPKTLTVEMQRIYQEIQLNGNTFRQYMSAYVEDFRGVPTLHGGGMFAFFKTSVPESIFGSALKKASVRLVPGYSCGAPKHENWYRMSLGRTNGFTEEALSVLVKELEK